MTDLKEYYTRVVASLINQEVRLHTKQLVKHPKPSKYISALILNIHNGTSDTIPHVLNELGMFFLKGSEGFKKDTDTASECFSFAFAHGVTIAGLNLAATLTCLHKTDLNYAIRLFSFLESQMKKGCIELKNKRNDVYYLGGILFFRTQNNKEARRCFKGVRQYHPYRKSAREYINKIDTLDKHKLGL